MKVLRSRISGSAILTIAALGLSGCGDEKSVAPDTTPPQIELLHPEDGLHLPVPRSVIFQARATDNTGIQRVEFLFDGVIVGSDSAATGDLFDYVWQTAPLAIGSHQAAARAHDRAGNAAEDTSAVVITSGQPIRLPQATDRP